MKYWELRSIPVRYKWQAIKKVSQEGAYVNKTAKFAQGINVLVYVWAGFIQQLIPLYKIFVLKLGVLTYYESRIK